MEEQQEKAQPWFAIKLYIIKQKMVEEALQAHGYTTFIPMAYRTTEDENHHVKQELKPVVSNLIFVRKKKSESELRTLLSQLNFKLSVIKKSPGSRHFYPIPHKQMEEFQLMCNPESREKIYLSENESALKVGTPVLVKFGPMKGLTGKLVRANKKYYLLKEVPGMGVMLKMSRWCCEPLIDSLEANS